MKCPECDHELNEKIVDTINGIACEISYDCPTHGTQAYWAYGHFDPAYDVNA